MTDQGKSNFDVVDCLSDYEASKGPCLAWLETRPLVSLSNSCRLYVPIFLGAASVSGILKTAEENLQELSQYREEHAQVAELTRRPLDTNSGTASHMTSISIVVSLCSLRTTFSEILSKRNRAKVS